MKLKLTLLILLFIFLTNRSGQTGVGDWTTFTSQNDIRDLILSDDYIWCATNGGVFSYQISNGTYRQFQNTNGLTSVNAQTIEVDQEGHIWVGFADGWINYYDPVADNWKNIRDYLGHQIYDLETVGDSLLVALDLGISLYDIRKKEVKETYKHLGWNLPAEIAVFDIMVVNREIWATTGSGIARSSFDLANLMAPESWKNYTTSQGLPTNEANSLVAHHDSIYVGTKAGAAILRDQRWDSLSYSLPYADVKKLVSKNRELYALTYGYVSRWIPEEYHWQNVAEYVRELSCLAIADNGDLWVGRNKSGSAKGFAHFSMKNETWEYFTSPGPPSNEFNGLAVDKNGILWCASARDGIFKYDGISWQQYTTADGLVNDGIKSATVDSETRKWFGSIGGGLIMIDEDEKITVFHKDHLSAAGASQDWIVVPDVKVDRYNNAWLLNTEANNSRIVAVYTPLLEWYYFTVEEGILSNVVTSLDIDWADRVWIGTQAGVSVIDYNNTLAYKPDDVIKENSLTTADGLESNSIRDIAIDQDNIVWIATDGGLNYWYWDSQSQKGVVKYQTGLLSNSVNVIAVDIRNNKWFGTSAGVSILAPDGYTFTHYTTQNSSLVNDNVTSFGFDFESGKVYIGTANGLSVLETPYSRPREDLSQVKAGPNPFIIGKGKQFTFLELSDDVAIKFLTENGMVVRHIPKDEILGAYTIWDGRDDNGEYVASGIYVYVIYNEEIGLNQVGKVAVIR
jgi:ligand-binding sensor domain-containing protein